MVLGHEPFIPHGPEALRGEKTGEADGGLKLITTTLPTPPLAPPLLPHKLSAMGSGLGTTKTKSLV